MITQSPHTHFPMITPPPVLTGPTINRSHEFTAFIRDERGFAYCYAFKCLGDADDASDAVQDAILKAWTAFETYDRERPFRKWFSCILHHTIVDRIRLASRRSKGFVQVPLDESMALSIDAYTEVWDDGDDDIHEDIQAAIGRLSKENQAIIRMRYLDGMKLNDIAKAINRPHWLARKMITKAMAALREAVADGS